MSLFFKMNISDTHLNFARDSKQSICYEVEELARERDHAMKESSQVVHTVIPNV